MRVCAHTPVRSSERRSHRQRTHRPAERHPAGPTDQNEQTKPSKYSANVRAQKGREGGPRKQTRRGRSRAPCFRACVGVMQVPLQCLCPNIVHASVLKVSYMCLDTSAGTSGNRGGARPSFRMRGPICAGPYLMPPKFYARS